MKRGLLAAAAVVTVLLVGGIAWASIPGPDGVIHGCYKTNNPSKGTVVVVDDTASCPSGYTTLNWNQTGPAGPAGADGVSGYEVVFKRSADTPGGLLAQVNVACPSGKVAVGGGYSNAVTTDGTVIWEISATTPTPSGGWVVIAINVAPDPRAIDVSAVCVTEG
jgi:hypothetical protein